MTRQNQIIAVEKGIKSKTYAEITELHKTCQKPELFNGFTKLYEKIGEEGEDLPPESKRVQFNVEDMLPHVAHILAELFDITATKDWTNCLAKGNVEIDGTMILEGAPVTYLLFLEKQLNDIRTFVDKLPVLDENERWSKDDVTGWWITSERKTHRTRKIARPIVLFPATIEHPAQTQLITEDVLAGYWKQVQMSGAIPRPRQKQLLERVDKLQNAVKFARESANDQEVVEKQIGQKLLDYLFSV